MFVYLDIIIKWLLTLLLRRYNYLIKRKCFMLNTIYMTLEIFFGYYLIWDGYNPKYK